MQSYKKVFHDLTLSERVHEKLLFVTNFGLLLKNLIKIRARKDL